MNKRIFALAILALSMVACSDDDTHPDPGENQLEFNEEVAMSAEVDAIADDILNIIEDQYSEQNPNGRYNMQGGGNNGLLPDCATITTVASGNTWERTIDFGTEGCELANGNVLKGAIILNGTNDWDAMSQTINYSFNEFYHNNWHIEGNKFAVRVLANENGNPQSTISLDLSATSGDITITREGSRIWEWIEGIDTPFNPFDNEYLVTGSWTTDFPGNTLTTAVTNALHIKLNCPHIVEGSLHFETTSNEATLDYGAGTCDNQATVTINGSAPINIVLGN